MSEAQEIDGIRYETDGTVAIITLCRPKELNTLQASMWKSWADFVTKANQDDAINVIVFIGEGKAFSAGADLKTFLLPRVIGGEPLIENDPYLGGLGLPCDWVALIRDSKPIISAVNGLAVGGGITSLLPTDYIMASDQAKFSFPFVSVGIVPELGSSHYLARRVGFGKASDLLLSASVVDSNEALSIKLIDQIVPAEELRDAAISKAKSWARLPTQMMQMTKTLLTENTQEADMNKVWERESKALNLCITDHGVLKAGLEQFTKKSKR